MEWKFVEPLKDSTAIHRVEEALNVKLPGDFVELVKTHNHGTPVLDTLDTEKRSGKAFGELLSFNLDEQYNILSEYDLIKAKLPPQVIPFAGDAGGNYLCFDYRKSLEEPAVVYWDHEQLFDLLDDELVVPDHDTEYQYYALEAVADNLAQLLEKLYTDDEDDADEEEAEIIWEDFMDEEELKELDDENFAAVNARRVANRLAPLNK